MMGIPTHKPIVLARDRKNKYILLGGLGSLGVGEMWFEDDGQRYKDFVGYDEAVDENYEAPKTICDKCLQPISLPHDVWTAACPHFPT